MQQKKWTKYLLAAVWGIALGCMLFFWQYRQQVGVDISDDANTPVQRTRDSNLQFPLPNKTSYNMKLHLNVEKMTLSGRSTIITVNSSGRPLRELCLTAYPNIFKQREHTPVPLSLYQGGFTPSSLDIKWVKVNGKKADVHERGLTIFVRPSGYINAGQKIDIEMEWDLTIPPVAYRLGYQDGVFMLGNFYPWLETYDNQGWHHAVQVPFGDPFCISAADYTVALSLPGAYQVISGAPLVYRFSDDRGNETWVFSSSRARDFAFAAFTPGNRCEKREVGGVGVEFWGQGPGLKEAADQAAGALRYFQQLYGAYPHRELRLVEVPMEGFSGMEYDGLIFVSNHVLASSYDKRKQAWLIAHEVAHQWWYAMVGNDQAREPWMDEALACYSADRYLRAAGMGSRDHLSRPQGLGREISGFKSREDYQKTVYSGGEWFWDRMEKQMGDHKLMEALKRYARTGSGKVVTRKELFDCLAVSGLKGEVAEKLWNDVR